MLKLMSTRPKTIQDYQQLAISRGFIYLSNDIPKNTKTKGGWFQCSEGHQWNTGCYDKIKQGKSCPYCSGKISKTLQDYKQLAYEKGFTYISTVIPKNVDTSGGIFQCSVGHNWNTSCYSSIKQNHGCPYCKNRIYKTINDYQQLAIEKGFVYLSNDIPKDTNTSGCVFQCSFGHQWNTGSYDNIQRNRGCPYCSGLVPKSLYDYQQLAISRGFIYLSNDIPINTKTPGGIFQCLFGHQWNSGCYSGIKQGSGCPYCVNKTEAILKEKLSQYFPQLICQYKPEWIRNPKSNKLMSYDFLITYGNFNIIIELDGEQHFKDLSVFNSSAEENRKRDIYKMKMANQCQHYVIRLLQVDVLNDRYDYMSCILRTLTEIVNSRATQWNYYLTHGRDYDEHQRDFNLYNRFDELL